MLTFGIFWYRFHNHVADRIAELLYKAYKDPDVIEEFGIDTSYSREDFDHHFDEKIFNEARKWVIATHQVRSVGFGVFNIMKLSIIYSFCIACDAFEIIIATSLLSNVILEFLKSLFLCGSYHVPIVVFL